MSMSQLDTSGEKLFAKRGHGMIFSDDGDTTSLSSEPRTPKVAGALKRTAATTMMMTTMTSGWR
jgi:hypothetical protein